MEGDGWGGGVARVIERWCRWNVDWEVGGWWGQQADDNKGIGWGLVGSGLMAGGCEEFG